MLYWVLFWIFVGLAAPYAIHAFFRWLDKKVLLADPREGSASWSEQQVFAVISNIPVVNIITCFYYFLHGFNYVYYICCVRRVSREVSAHVRQL